MPQNYVVRPKTGEVFPADRWDDLKSDLTLRVATDEEQAAIVAGRDFREVTRVAEAVIDPALLDPAGRFGSTTIDLPPDLTPYAPQPPQVEAGRSATMEVALGRIPAGEPDRVVFASDEAQPTGTPGLADQLEAVEAMDNLADIRTAAEQFEVPVADTDSLDAVKARLKRRLIQLANEAAASPAPTLAEVLAAVDTLTAEQLDGQLAEYGVKVRANAADAAKRAALKQALAAKAGAGTQAA